MTNLPHPRASLALLVCLASSAFCRSEPAPGIDLGSLFASLASSRTVYSSFTEERWFGFRKEPVVLEGEMRMDPERGLSLRYLKPQERTMIVDSKGILLRDVHGRERAIPPDPRAAGIAQALLGVLKFDRAQMESLFTVTVEGDPLSWKITLLPRDPVQAKALGTVEISGAGTAVRHIELRRSANQRVEIRINTTRERVTFTADELRLYFR